MNKHVAIFSPFIPPDFAGAGKRALNHAMYIAQKKQKVSLITTTNTDLRDIHNLDLIHLKIPRWYKSDKKIHKIYKKFYIPILFFKILRLIRKQDFEIIHCIPGFSNMALLILLASLLYNKKVVMETTLLGSDDPLHVSKGVFGKIKKFFLKKVNAVVSISPLLDKSCKEFGYNISKRNLIPNSVDINKFKPLEFNKERQRIKLGIDSNDIIFLYVGILRPRKGIKKLVEIFNEIKDEYDSAKLVLAGPTNKDMENKIYTKKVKELISKYHLSNRVIFTGEISNVQEWMQISDIFLFASEREGFGNVLIEAMSTGLPVVAKKIEGITDFIIDNKYNGYIAQSKQEFIESINRLLANKDHYNTVSSNARETVVEKFSNEKIMEQYFNLYNNL